MRTTLVFSIAIALVLAFLPAKRALPGTIAPWTRAQTPALILKDLDGRTVDLSDYRGKVVLVNFWATWCEPCRTEMPSIQRLGEKLAGQPFAILTVNVDEPEARVRRYVGEIKLGLRVLVDRNKIATREWGAGLLPSTFVIGGDGRVRYRALGDVDWSADSVVRMINDLISAAEPRQSS